MRYQPWGPPRTESRCTRGEGRSMLVQPVMWRIWLIFSRKRRGKSVNDVCVCVSLTSCRTESYVYIGHLLRICIHYRFLHLKQSAHNWNLPCFQCTEKCSYVSWRHTKNILRMNITHLMKVWNQWHTPIIYCFAIRLTRYAIMLKNVEGVLGIECINMMTSSNGNIFRVTGALCGEFTGDRWSPSQRPVTRSFDVFFDLRLNPQLNKQWRRRRFETPSHPLWRPGNFVANLVISLDIDASILWISDGWAVEERSLKLSNKKSNSLVNMRRYNVIDISTSLRDKESQFSGICGLVAIKESISMA